MYSGDLGTDPRYPGFGPAAQAAGIRSALAYRLLVDGADGALNLYAQLPNAYGSDDRAKAAILAALAGTALSAAVNRRDAQARSDNLEQALLSREVIGQAILIERERITAEQAFDILRRASQHLNEKLRGTSRNTSSTPAKTPTPAKPLTDRCDPLVVRRAATVPRGSPATDARGPTPVGRCAMRECGVTVAHDGDAPHGAPRRWRDRRGPAAVSVSIVVGLVDGPAAVLGSFLAIAHVAPLVVRRRYPLAVLGAMIATAFVYTLAGFPSVGLGPAALVAVFTVASARRPSAVIARDGRGDRIDGADRVGLGAHIETIVANGIAFAVAWFIGDRMRASRTRAEEAEHTRDEATREAVRDERLRIARELHDVVAHALSVIAVQSGTAPRPRQLAGDGPRRSVPSRPRAERRSRRCAGSSPSFATTTGPEPLGPAPGLGQLDDLVAQTVAAGLPVRVDVQGERGAAAWRRCGRLPDRARGFTNARKHAHASHVDLGVATAETR